MTKIVSATTRFAGKVSGSREAGFVSKARVLLVQAVDHRAAGEWDLALEVAYQAALRTAGARIEAAASGRSRRRRPAGAWEQLRLVDADGERWALTFSRFSRVRSRVSTGLDHDVDPEVVDTLIALVTEFLGEVESGGDGLPAAA